MTMADSWTTITLILCCTLIPASQSQTDVETCAVLDCSLSTYILIAIAVLYSIFSLICVVLIIIACRCKRRPRVRTKVQPAARNPLEPTEDELDDVFFSRALDPITETTTTTDLDIFENAMARDNSDSEHNKSSSSDEEGHDSSDSRESNQDTSLVIKNPFSRNQRHKHITGSVGKGSPLLFHQPKSSPIPPAKVPVPYSEPDGLGGKPSPGRGPVRLPPLETTPRQRSKAAAAALGREKSPFSRRKRPQNEVAKDISVKRGTPKAVNPLQQLKSQSSIKKKGGVPMSEGDLKFQMVKISQKWRRIGEAFQLSTNVLNNISIICSNESDTCMLRVCEEWLRIRKDRNWEELIDILQLEKIKENQLASYLQTSYCNGPQTQDKLASNNSEGSLSWSEGNPPTDQREDEADGSISWPDESLTIL